MLYYKQKANHCMNGCKTEKGGVRNASEIGENSSVCAAFPDGGLLADWRRTVKACVFSSGRGVCRRLRGRLRGAVALPVLRQTPRPQRRRDLPALRQSIGPGRKTSGRIKRTAERRRRSAVLYAKEPAPTGFHADPAKRSAWNEEEQSARIRSLALQGFVS